MNARTRITTAWLLSTAMALAACSSKENPSTPTVKEVQVTVPQATLVAGTTSPVTATSIFTDSSKKDCSTTATYSSSDASVVAVTAGASGTVLQAKKEGTATITATCDGVSGTVDITVTAPTLAEIQVTPATLSLAKGTTSTSPL